MSSFVGQPAIKGSTESMRMALLTVSLIGVAFTWGFEMTYCTPYLLALGLTKSKTSLVWIAGPLSGLVMQPIVGVIADRSQSKYGRRRPFMVVGSLIVAVGLLTLGWAKEITAFFVEDKQAAKSYAIALAVMSIYALDFVINAVQSCARSLIVDSLPIPKQQTGSAWASRMVSTGHLIGYAAGAVDLVSIFGTTFGDTQFKQLAVISGLGLVGCNWITAWAVTERVLVSSKGQSKELGFVQIFQQIFHTLTNLPPRVQAICWAQFWAWIGWFPFMFYSSTWVGETYFRYDAPQDVRESGDVLGAIGRVGSMALVIFSTFSTTGAYVLPLLVKSPTADEGYTPRPPRKIAGIVTAIYKHRPDLLTMWWVGHLIFACSMIFAPFATSYRVATTLITFCAMPYVLGSWAPFSFLGVEVNRLSSAGHGNGSNRRLSDARSPSIELESAPSASLLRSDTAPDNSAVGTATTSTGELSGIYFGILNIYTTLPQFVGTFISTIVFSILEPGKSPELAHDAHPDEHHGTDGPNAISVCLFIGALAACGACLATRKLRHL